NKIMPRYLILSFFFIVVSGEVGFGNALGGMDRIQLWRFHSHVAQWVWATIVWALIAAATLRLKTPLHIAIATFLMGLSAELTNAFFLHLFDYTSRWAPFGIPEPIGAALMFEANLAAWWLAGLARTPLKD